jgi:type I restriction enzyme S subunit
MTKKNTTIAEQLNAQIDRSEWTLHKVSDFVENIVEKIVPKDSGLSHYIGLEHLDSGSLHIKRFGDPSSLVGDKLKIYKGDIIFAKRNAYLKRAAVAEFDAVASAHSMVLRAKPEIALPEFLPFFMMSEVFWTKAIEISVGSLSPTINWKTLAKQEFLLPPKDQQAKLAELLWAVDAVVEKQIQQAAHLEKHQGVLRNTLVFEGIGDETEYSTKLKRTVSIDFSVTTLGELVDENLIEAVQDGNHGEIHPKSSQYVSEGIPFIMANSLVDGEIDFINTKRLPQVITDKLRIGFSQPRDVLISHKGTIGETAIVPNQIDYPYLMLTPQVTYYRCNRDKLMPEFLFEVFNSSYFQNQLRVLSSQSTRSYIGIRSQRRLKLTIPKDIETQQRIIDRLKVVQTAIDSAKDSIVCSRMLLKSLINEIFSQSV